LLYQTGSAADVPGEIERFGASRTGIGAAHNPRPLDPSQAFHQDVGGAGSTPCAAQGPVESGAALPAAEDGAAVAAV